MAQRQTSSVAREPYRYPGEEAKVMSWAESLSLSLFLTPTSQGQGSRSEQKLAREAGARFRPDLCLH